MTSYKDKVCYLSEYLDYPTFEEMEHTLSDVQKAQIHRSVLESIRRLSAEYSDMDLLPVNSMWSIIDPAPLDVDVDEKQENINDLVEALSVAGASKTAERVVRFNEANRKKIADVFRSLSRCVIQGDLNESNILISDGKFAGIIDFNMAGTEVNINHFCCETNDGVEEDEFCLYPASEIFEKMKNKSAESLDIILEYYSLNSVEKSVINNYRNIVMISQYPNVCMYIRSLKKYPDKVVELIELIVGQNI